MLGFGSTGGGFPTVGEEDLPSEVAVAPVAVVPVAVASAAGDFLVVVV